MKKAKTKNTKQGGFWLLWKTKKQAPQKMQRVKQKTLKTLKTQKVNHKARQLQTKQLLRLQAKKPLLKMLQAKVLHLQKTANKFYAKLTQKHRLKETVFLLL